MYQENMIKHLYIVNKSYESLTLFFILYNMKLKKYKKKNNLKYFYIEIIIIIISIILSFIIINYFSSEINNTIMPLAESRTRKYITKIINNSTNDIKFNNQLFTIDKKDNEIKMINYNSYECTKLINEITNNIQNNLDNLEINKDDFVIAEIPIGVIFKNNLIKNIGPKIKVRFDIVGDVLSELETEVKPYGINNALIEVRVKLNANARVILPFTTKEINVINIIPISINVINGNIPESYISSFR